MKTKALGPYAILSSLGAGGMGEVFLAECTEAAAGLDASTRVALKVIHPHLLSEPGFFKRFLREARIGQEVDHTNVVRTFDCDATLADGESHHYLVMEHVDGQTLRELLKEMERVPEELCRHIGREVAKGLQAIHDAGVVHRDVKPENVLITETHVVKVMDLGVARLKDEAIRLSKAGGFVGSLEYAAPEQFLHSGEGTDNRTDLHALGLVLYELATGQNPYRDEDASKVLRRVLDTTPRPAGEVNPQLSPFFEELLKTLLAKEPAERISTAEALAGILDAGEDSAWWKERAKALRHETRRPLRRIRVPRETALYGREKELERLEALYDQAAKGDGQVLLIAGEAGIGKTRLADEFVAGLQAAGEDFNLLFGSYPPGGAATAAGAFSTAFREHFGAAGLEETLTSYLAETRSLVPAFAALLRGESTPTGTTPLNQDSLQTVFVRATRSLAAERPTIVLIEDLHFAPDDGRALFASLALACPGHRVLLIGSSRRGLSERWAAELERIEHASLLELARLGPKDLLHLLEDSFRSTRLAHELAGQIAIKSDGNPFFAFEIIRGLREGQYITKSADGTWVSTQVIEDIEIPTTVLDMIQARLKDLSEEQRELLDVAACCGYTFDPDLVADVVGMPAIPALRAFGRIEHAHRLVRSAGRDFVFDHHQVQEALYDAQPERLRERYHAAIGEALEREHASEGPDGPTCSGGACIDLCEHFLKGRAGSRALPYLRPAMRHLTGGYMHGQAIDLAHAALAVDGLLEGRKRLELLLALDKPLYLTGRTDLQLETIDELEQLAEAVGDTELAARTHNSIGVAYARTDRSEDAIERFKRSRALYAELGDKRAEANALNGMALASCHVGNFDDAEAAFADALALQREIGDREGEATALGNLAWAIGDRGRTDEARRLHEQALDIYEDIDDQLGVAIALGNLANDHMNNGRMGEAHSFYERSLIGFQQMGYRNGESICYGNLAELMHLLGRLDEAQAHLDHAVEIARETGDRRLEGEYAGQAASLAFERGEMTRGIELEEEAIAICRETNSRPELTMILLGLAEAWIDEGVPDKARPPLDEALSLAREMGIVRIQALGLAAQARLPDGDASAATAFLEEHGEELRPTDRMHCRYALWRTTDDAAHLTEARRLLDDLIERTPESYRASRRDSVRVHRAIMEASEA
ncbi:MAG: protein kinase [Planctomycetota bacterium]|nr:protein kinase [Planctomycetota bacterium]